MLGGLSAVLVVCEVLPLGVEALSRFKQELSMKPPHKQRSANDASRRQNAVQRDVALESILQLVTA